MTPLLLQALYSGLLTGGTYALIALGLALVFGTMRVSGPARGERVGLAAGLASPGGSRFGARRVVAAPAAGRVARAAAGVFNAGAGHAGRGASDQHSGRYGQH